VATFLVALAAFDYFYLDGKYLHSVQAVANSLLHLAGGQQAPALGHRLSDPITGDWVAIRRAGSGRPGEKSRRIKPQRHSMGCLETRAALYKSAAGSEVRRS
jgi:hypothetical protein